MSPLISQQLKNALVLTCTRIASHGFTVGFDFIGGVPQDIITTYPRSWLQEYQENDYIMHDPVVLWGAENSGVKTWNELKYLFPDVKPDVISTARRRGMRNGSAISFCVDRKRAIMGITHESVALTPSELSEIRHIMTDILFEMPPPSSSVVSAKARMLLSLASRGFTNNQIAEELSVSTRAVYAMRNRTVNKLRAKTLAQAVLYAYKSRIID